jgi:ABC-type polysaccharide/polyol phosphate transport system ATPase subunit
LVAHSLPDVLEMCSRAVWLDRGEIQAQGPAEEVVEAYRASKSDVSVAAGAD